MKIQLDKEALERLIGNDTDIEVELRQSVVEEFSKRHLKAVANSAMIERLEREIKKTTNDMMFGDQKTLEVKLPNPVKVAIRKQIDRTINDFVTETIGHAMDHIQKTMVALMKSYEAKLQEAVENASKEQIDVLVKAEVERKLLQFTEIITLRKEK